MFCLIIWSLQRPSEFITTTLQFPISSIRPTSGLVRKRPGKRRIRERDYDAVDGLSRMSPALLVSAFCDCVPVYLYDPKQEAIGLIHSGWKGTAGKISAKAVRMMGKEYGSRPEDMIACIGPSICQDCYEVSTDLYEVFSKQYDDNEMKDLFHAGKDGNHYQLSLWRAIEITLKQEGVRQERIHTTDICTCHNPELFFSHRYTNGKRGNLAAILMLLPEPPEDPELFKNLLPKCEKNLL